LLQQDRQVLHGPGQPVQFGDDHHSHGAGANKFQNANHAGPVQVFGAFTGVNQDVQKFDVMDGGHGLDLLDLRFERNAPVGLLVGANSDVTDRFCFHSLRPFQHAGMCWHKLSGGRFRPTSVWETPGEDQPGLRPAKHTDDSHGSNGLPKTLPQKKDRG
jgi:hypothetical protein